MQRFSISLAVGSRGSAIIFTISSPFSAKILSPTVPSTKTSSSSLSDSPPPTHTRHKALQLQLHEHRKMTNSARLPRKTRPSCMINSAGTT